MRPLESWLLNYAVNALWQVPLVFTAGWLAARAARRSGPSFQHTLWTSTLIAEVFLPACSARPDQVFLSLLHWLISLHQSVTPQVAQVAVTIGPAHAVGGLQLAPTVLTAAALLYLTALAYFIARLGIGLRQTISLRRRAQPIDLTGYAGQSYHRYSQLFGVRNAIVALSTEIACPITLGLRRHVLLLPSELDTTLLGEDLDAALAHEFAHMRRRDFAKNLAYEVLSLPVAFHPLLWLTRRRIAETRELICDAMAAEAVAGRQRYARSLLRLATKFSEQAHDPTPHAIGIFDAHPFKNFERRIMNLTHHSTPLKGAARIATATLSLVLIGGACTSALALRMNVSAPTMAAPAQTPHPETVRVGSGVVAGNRLTFVSPVYPEVAKRAELDGTVVLDAIIGKDGKMKNLQVISATNPMFNNSAIEAVRQWTYKPYLLNGEPRDVETTITVNYTLHPQPASDSSPAPNPSVSNVEPPAMPNQMMHIGGNIKKPIVIHSVDPQYSQQARDAKFSGVVEVYLWVDKDGHPSHIRVVKSAGMGLDESAVDAVRQYRFKPATLDGKPVTVDLYIDVNFQTFKR